VAGAGKTRLLSELLQSTSRAGWRTVVAVPDPESHLVPTRVLAEAGLTSEPPLLTPADIETLAQSPDSRYWFVQAFRDAVESAAQDGTLLFTVDDLQWADAASVAIIRSLVETTRDLPILWAFAIRAGEYDEGVTAALRDWSARAASIEVAALSDESTVDMAGDLLGAVPDARLTATLRRAENVPLLVSELVQGLLEEDLISVSDGVATVQGERIPERFGASIRERILRLPRQAQHLVLVASVLGRDFSVPNLADLLEETTSNLIDGLDRAIEADILVASDRGNPSSPSPPRSPTRPSGETPQPSTSSMTLRCNWPRSMRQGLRAWRTKRST
jgi:predicted ATPase